jgi:beta-lactamase superfamily II metal-dependent hydrolase
MLIAVLTVGVGYAAFVRSHRKPEIEGPVLSAWFLSGDLTGTAVIKTPEGKVVVVDPPAGRDQDKLAQVLRDPHAREVTVVVSESPRNGDVGLRGIERIAKIERVIRPEVNTTVDSWETPAKKSAVRSERELAVAGGDTLKLSPSVRLEVPTPARGGDKRQKAALVFRLRFGRKSILFASDVDPKGEVALMKSGETLTSSAFVASCKGRSSSNSLELLSMVRPEIIVLAESDRPSARLLNRLSSRNTGAALYRTDKDGTIEIETNGRSIQVTTQGGER